MVITLGIVIIYKSIVGQSAAKTFLILIRKSKVQRLNGDGLNKTRFGLRYSLDP